MSWRGLPLLAWRFLVLIALMFWQGGFTFYAAVVVPIGQEVVGRETQPFITRQVAVWINISGGIALLMLALDVAAARREARWAHRLRWLTWLGMAAALVALVCLYPQIDRYLDPEIQEISGHRALRPWHRAYLWVSTVQWGFGLVYVGLTLRAWREADHVG
jgi:hypothetical protein